MEKSLGAGNPCTHMGMQGPVHRAHPCVPMLLCTLLLPSVSGTRLSFCDFCKRQTSLAVWAAEKGLVPKNSCFPCLNGPIGRSLGAGAILVMYIVGLACVSPRDPESPLGTTWSEWTVSAFCWYAAPFLGSGHLISQLTELPGLDMGYSMAS